MESLHATADETSVKKRNAELIQELQRTLSSFEGQDKHRSWYRDLLLSLGTETLLNCTEIIESHVRGGMAIARQAWATRNLLELHYWVRYVLQSQENARRFHEDAICDYLDLLKKFDALVGSHAQFSTPLAQSRSQIAELARTMQQIKEADRHLKVAEIARGFGEDVLFTTLNKYLSKLAHPTSFWIQLRLQGGDQALAPSIFYVNTDLIQRTLPALTEEIRRQRIEE
jgi:hypothetical protein